MTRKNFEMTEWKPNPINPILIPKKEWFIVYYGENTDWDWYGLLANDGKSRGIPEGSKSSWLELIQAMRNNEKFSETRLDYTPDKGISSPRNTNHESETFDVNKNDAEFIEHLLNNPTSWRNNQLKGNPIKINK